MNIIELLEQEARWKFLRLFEEEAVADNRGRTHKVWMENNHPILIESAKFFREKLNYLHDNPVRKGYVEKPEHSTFSSAKNYVLGDSSVLDLDVLER